MTDAERIAEYCTNHESALVTAEDVQRWRDGYPLPKTTALMTMLSDVRREEREACLADIAAEQREWSGNHPRSALDCARERIVKRGAK